MHARKGHRLDDIVGVGAKDDRGRPLVDRAIPDSARLVIGGVRRQHQVAAEALPQLLNGCGGRMGCA
ncbi:hypothetical protein [Rhizobium sp. BR 315]|uniref:hypothetical protein n=1 Tax=Rhizobium sp. BR 315 TaxID=3040014 RepID=UPI003D34A68A